MGIIVVGGLLGCVGGFRPESVCEGPAWLLWWFPTCEYVGGACLAALVVSDLRVGELCVVGVVTLVVPLSFCVSTVGQRPLDEIQLS